APFSARRWSAPAAQSPRRAAASRGRGVHLQPEQATPPPPLVHADFLNAFAHALHGVFLWGVALAVIPAVLAWLLKEVPLRTTVGPAAELSSEQAPAAATPEERLQPPAARRAGVAHSPGRAR